MPRTLLALLVALFLSLPAFAVDPPLPSRGSSPEDIIHGGPVGPVAKAAVDSFMLMGPTGSGAPYIGDFEGGQWHGWTSSDRTQPGPSRWHAATYQAVAGNYSAWCGYLGFPACSEFDPAGGYGNNWDEWLEWRGTVADPGLSTIVTVTGTMNLYTEQAYDFVRLGVVKAGDDFQQLAAWTGIQSGIAVDETTAYGAADYVGPGGDEVVVQFRFDSDGAFSDQDCHFPTSGAAQLDDVTIFTNNGAGTGGLAIDFEDGTLAPFTTPERAGVGDFAKLWNNLRDLDPCVENWSWQVAFIDDGQVVPGTGGTECVQWCYGPYGYIVNNSGGLLGPDHHLDNRIESPVMAWPDPAHEGGLFSFGVYLHEDLMADSPGIFADLGIRSISTGDPADLEEWMWNGGGSLQYGPAGYRRRDVVVDYNLEPSPTHVQVYLRAYELGYVWGWDGDNGTPAPYFDNVRFVTYPLRGPVLTTRAIDLAQDAFPASGTLDLADPGALSCRFDMAKDISGPGHMRNDPGDSVVFWVEVLRHDAVLEGTPRMHYRVKRNPFFAPYKTSPLPDVGTVDAQIPNLHGGDGPYFCELPDEGFLFPGDQVHYYFTASDRDTFTNEVRTAILPADTTGFSDFYDPLGYDARFTMRCLPTVTDHHILGPQPEVLFWNDFGLGAGLAEWYSALRVKGILLGMDFDVYTTQSPYSGVGNGLGGRATAAQLAGYDFLLYGCGDLTLHTLGNGDDEDDPSADVQLLDAWLDLGDKGAFLAGESLAGDLSRSGPAATGFLASSMQVAFVDDRIRDLIGGQASPRVLVADPNPVFENVPSWIAYGGCPYGGWLDAVTATGTGQRLAEYAGPDGTPGGYPYSAATLATGVGTAGTSRVVSVPVAFGDIRTDPAEGAKYEATFAARARVLDDVLTWFWLFGDPVGPSHVPGAAAVFAATQHPNPFNPATTITYTAPRPGRLTVKVYDLRGRLVRTVFDDQVTVSGSIDWDGTDSQGARAASGVYFYEVRLNGEVKVGKMALVK